MHAKTMIVDGRLAYLGSIDLQTASTSDDRELGIMFRMPPLVARLSRQFRSDWAASSTLSAAAATAKLPAFDLNKTSTAARHQEEHRQTKCTNACIKAFRIPKSPRFLRTSSIYRMPQLCIFLNAPIPEMRQI